MPLNTVHRTFLGYINKKFGKHSSHLRVLKYTDFLDVISDYDGVTKTTEKYMKF